MKLYRFLSLIVFAALVFLNAGCADRGPYVDGYYYPYYPYYYGDGVIGGPVYIQGDHEHHDHDMNHMNGGQPHPGQPGPSGHPGGSSGHSGGQSGRGGR